MRRAQDKSYTTNKTINVLKPTKHHIMFLFLEIIFGKTSKKTNTFISTNLITPEAFS